MSRRNARSARTAWPWARVRPARGYDNAGLYDPQGVGGTHVMYVLHHADKPSLYAGLPDEPTISPVVKGWKGPAKTVGLAVAGLAAVGAVLHGIFGKPNEVTSHEEEEAQELVDETENHGGREA
jgi:formate dehydrogenase iron-sulfur subunit